MTWLEAARRIVANQQYEVINPTTGEPVETEWVLDDDDNPLGEKLVATNSDGVLLDGFTAQHMLAVYDALKTPEAKAKFEAMNLLRAVDVTWALVKKVGVR